MIMVDALEQTTEGILCVVFTGAGSESGSLRYGRIWNRRKMDEGKRDL